MTLDTFHPEFPLILRFHKCEFCEKWEFTNVNFVENEISEMWILRKFRFQKGEFCKNLDFNVTFRIKCGFLPQCVDLARWRNYWCSVCLYCRSKNTVHWSFAIFVSVSALMMLPIWNLWPKLHCQWILLWAKVKPSFTPRRTTSTWFEPCPAKKWSKRIAFWTLTIPTLSSGEEKHSCHKCWYDP